MTVNKIGKNSSVISHAENEGKRNIKSVIFHYSICLSHTLTPFRMAIKIKKKHRKRKTKRKFQMIDLLLLIAFVQKENKENFYFH